MPGSWMNAPVAADPVTTGEVIVRMVTGGGAGGAGGAVAAAGATTRSLSTRRAAMAGSAAGGGCDGGRTLGRGDAGRLDDAAALHRLGRGRGCGRLGASGRRGSAASPRRAERAQALLPVAHRRRAEQPARARAHARLARPAR